MNSNHAGIARAKRKLAIAYKLTGKRSEYERIKGCVAQFGGELVMQAA
jgi:hypothetical protein